MLLNILAGVIRRSLLHLNGHGYVLGRFNQQIQLPTFPLVAPADAYFAANRGALLPTCPTPRHLDAQHSESLAAGQLPETERQPCRITLLAFTEECLVYTQLYRKWVGKSQSLAGSRRGRFPPLGPASSSFLSASAQFRSAVESRIVSSVELDIQPQSTNRHSTSLSLTPGNLDCARINSQSSAGTPLTIHEPAAPQANGRNRYRN